MKQRRTRKRNKTSVKKTKLKQIRTKGGFLRAFGFGKKRNKPIVIKPRVGKDNKKPEPNLAMNERDTKLFECSDSYLTKNGEIKDLEFSCNKKLGEGHFGIVCGCHLNEGGVKSADPTKYYAVKFLSHKNAQAEYNVSLIINEIIRKNNEAGNYLVKYYPDLSKGAFKYAVVTEYMNGGSLESYILSYNSNSNNNSNNNSNKRAFLSSVLKIKKIIRDVYTAMNILHNNKLVHLDIAPRNVLVSSINSNTHVKLADFGNLNKISDLQKEVNVLMDKSIVPKDFKIINPKYFGNNVVFIDYYMFALLVLGLIHKELVHNIDYCVLNSLDNVLGKMSQNSRKILTVIDNSLTASDLGNHRETIKYMFNEML